MCRRLILFVSVFVPVGLPLLSAARADHMIASNPSPPNGESAVDINADLSWQAGLDANGHDVYFGTIFNDVNTATRTFTNGVLLSVKQAESNYQLSTLSLNTTYYWRIDEVNDSNIMQWPGEVWNFTTHTVPPDPNLTGWWRFEEGSGTTCVDSSNNNNSGSFGIDANGNPDSNNAPQWAGGRRGEHSLFFNPSDGNDFVTCGNDAIFDVSGPFTAMAWIKGPFNSGGINTIIGKSDAWKLYMVGDWELRFSICFFDDGVWIFTAYVILQPSFGPDWHHVAGAYDGSEIQLYHNGELVDVFDVNTAGDVCIDTNDLWIGGKDNGAAGEDWWMGHIDDVRIYDYNLSLVEIQSIYNEPYDIAHDPYPSDGEKVAVDVNGLLSIYWTPSANAISHNVYFGTSDPPPFIGNQSPNSYEPNGISEQGGIDLGGIYYWKIGEVNNNEDVNVYNNPVWSFTVAEYLLIDDFESYNYNIQLNEVWSQSGVGYVILQYDQTKCHEGSRAMKIEYHTELSAYIEAKNTYNIAQDWTTGDVKALTLYFLATGLNNDPEKLYVEVVDDENDSNMIIIPADANAITEVLLWQEWNIDLANFSANDVDLENIKSIAIGVGNKGWFSSGNNGKVTFDDIRLYRCRCVPEYGPVADFTGDCKVDYQDINALELSWLDTVAAPNDSNLLGYWQLNGNGADSSGNGNTGTTIGKTAYGLGKSGKALGLFGDEDYMTVGNDSSFEFTGPFTVSAWIRGSGRGGEKSQTIVAKGGSAWRLYTISQDDKIEFAVDGLDTPNNPDPNVPKQSVSAELDVKDFQWHHVAGVYDGSYIYVYVDGVPEVLDINDACTPYTDDNDVWFGQNKDYDAGSEDYREWEGYIDEVRIYDYALSEAEIDYLAELPMDLTGDDKVNFKDIAELGKAWLKEQLWP